MYFEGQNYAEALKWFRLAADQGFAVAQFDLGHMYVNGQAVPQDYVRHHFPGPCRRAILTPRQPGD
jgi:TPR repeat protein